MSTTFDCYFTEREWEAYELTRLRYVIAAQMDSEIEQRRRELNESINFKIERAIATRPQLDKEENVN